MVQRKTYNGFIKNLENNQIIVFGSNPVGINGNPVKRTGGLALIAMENGWVKQGEKMDNKLSLSGKAWGLTTIAYPGQKRSVSPEKIIAGIQKLYAYAIANPSKEMMVAFKASGTILNGYSHEEMASMFGSAIPPENIIFEDEFLQLMRKVYVLEKKDLQRKSSVSQRP